MNPPVWCHACEVAGRSGVCWLCGGPLRAERPRWMHGLQITPGELRIAQHPEGRLTAEVMGPDAADVAAQGA